ncbi:HNH endonuclease [Micromonospora peucetia]|uniref:HNH endonuclease n=1 Tax=Micromonospora peucetia TaxID=47871 RepID=A0A1C6UC98_9ACTN|nr:HNH endonuclease [Micromonospora peucetia]MCX4386469.1 HNH endonuclease [Micromonospora peucetia]WSA33804.1 HNH endonuclease [Micromonospora peucetia]SCL51584.1 HNH endonuclease [Micromonospora peucetia]
MPDSTPDGLLAVFSDPQPFTRDTVAQAPLAPGAHVVILDGEIVYVGETGRTLRERLGAHLRGNRGSSVLHKQVGELLDREFGRPATTAEIAAWLGGCEIRWRETDDPKALKDALLTRIAPPFNQLLPGQRVTSTGAASRFERLADGPYFDSVVAANRAYLDAVVPDAATIEREYWALSCLPGTRTNPPRLSAVSMKTMETFVLHEPTGPAADARAEGFMVVRKAVLDRHWTPTGFRAAHPAITRWPSDYVDAGPDQECLAGGVDDLITALGDEGVVLAARALTEPLLRSRTLHARGHNQQLADAVLGRHEPTDWIYPVNVGGSPKGEDRDVWEYFHSDAVVDWQFSAGYHQIAAGDRIWACTTEPPARLVAAGVAWDDPYQSTTESGLEWRVAIRWNAELTRHLRESGEDVPVSAGSVRGVRGMSATEVDRLVDALEARSAPEPEALPEGRRRRLAEVTARQGQADFRRRLIEAYGRRCAITGCDTEAALQAAHISPYDGPATNRVTNGLLLRADVHNLFDRGLIWIDEQLLVRVKAEAAHYASWHGEELRLPARPADRPDAAALRAHRREATKLP